MMLREEMEEKVKTEKEDDFVESYVELHGQLRYDLIGKAKIIPIQLPELPQR